MDPTKKKVLILCDQDDLTHLDHQMFNAAYAHCKDKKIPHLSIFSETADGALKVIAAEKAKHTGPLVLLHHGTKFTSVGARFRKPTEGSPPVKILDISLFSRVMEKIPNSGGTFFQRIIGGFIDTNLS